MMSMPTPKRRKVSWRAVLQKATIPEELGIEKQLECIDIDAFLVMPEPFRQRILADILGCD
jgi:hypothetical protein